MKPIAKIDCQVNGIYYDKGNEIEVKDKEQLIELNERGFIEPLTMKQIQEFGKEPKIKRILRKEED